MSNDTAKTITTNIVPVQGTFEPLPPYECINLIGPAGTPFFAPTNPDLDGVAITNSTINSSVIGGTTPAAGTFTNVATTTGTITSPPSGPTSIVNQAYVDAVAQGLAFKQPADYTTTGNITLSGLTTQAGGDWASTLTAGERILVKDQSTQSQNGIYVAASGAWSRSTDANTWDELVSAYLFVTSGTLLSGSAWVNTNQQGGTLGVTAVIFVQFSNNALYTAGTGLTLSGFQFLITNTGVSAATYGSGSTVPAIAVNAQGQITSATNTSIAIAGSQVTSGTIDSARLSGSYSGITGVGTLTDLTVSNVITGSISGNAATATTAGSATTATTATNLAGGATGSIPYQSGAGATTFLAAGTNGQVLTLAGGVPTYATPTTGTVTSVGTAGTVNGLTLTGGPITGSGTVTLGGTLDLSAPPTIGNTTPNTGRFTTLTVDDNSTFGTSNSDTVTFNARINSDFDPATDNAYDLGRTGHEWRNLYIDGTANIDSLIADTADINAGTIDNTSIGATTAAAAKVTTLDISSTLALAGSTGTAGYVLTSNGASAPTWNANANGVTITDDTTTNATRYITFSELTAGTETTLDVSSTKLQFNPSTGNLTSTVLTSTNDATISGLTVGKGAGAVSTNVAVGASALAGNSVGSNNTALGGSALAANTVSRNTAIGYVAGAATTTGHITAVGAYALTSNTTGNSNVAVGGNNESTSAALQNNTTGNNNTAVGVAALQANTTASDNTAVGYLSLLANTTGSSNTAIGDQALYSNTTASNNTAVGYQAAYANTTGVGISAFGTSALAANTTGYGNCAFGQSALTANTTGINNLALGGTNAVDSGPALNANTTGSNNVAVGNAALVNNTTGSQNVAIGRQTLASNGTASDNTAVGYQAGYSNTTGSYNTAIGNQSLYSNTTGSYSTVVGYQAAYPNTTGQLTAVGALALRSNTTGTANDAFGVNTLNSNTTGSYNVALGDSSLQLNTTASNHTAMGYQALYANTTGANNTALGYGSLNANTTASNNTAVGYQAGYALTTGGNNTCIGLSAGYGTPVGGADITTGGNNIYIGGYSSPSASANSSEIVIGYNSVGKGTGTGFMNAGGGGNYAGNNSASWSTTSDKRVKKNIVNNNIGLEKIMQIQVRNFEYRKPEEITELPQELAIQKEGVQLGVIAQELQEVIPNCVKQESTGFLGVDPSDLTWYLINAVKELKAEIDQLKGK